MKCYIKFIDKSQFILITHNKETMKGSHRLYGVTMNKEIGETKLVSVDYLKIIIKMTFQSKNNEKFLNYVIIKYKRFLN